MNTTINLLDFNGFGIFEKSLNRIAQDPRLWKWLEEESSKVEIAQSNQMPFSLWQEMLAYTHGNTKNAIARMAILFQDPSNNDRMTEVLRKNGAPDSTVAAFINLAQYLITNSPSHFKTLKIYPESLPEGLPQSIYHLYVPAYLSQLLQAHGFNEKLAFFIPFLLDEQYEMLDDLYAKNHGLCRPHKIYVGYWGSLFGIQKFQLAIPLKEFTEAFQKSRADLLERILHDPRYR